MVFGQGQVGVPLATRLARAGNEVVVVRRHTAPPPAEGILVRTGDALDRSFVEDVTKGAAVVYHAMNVAYASDAWERELPPLMKNLLDATKQRARLVVLDNLYMLDATRGAMRENTERRVSGRKSAVRAQLDDVMGAAITAGDDIVIGRAGDFFGPNATRALISEKMVRGISEGRRPMLFGDVDALHSFSYIPDVADALVALGAASSPPERVLHLPVHTVAPRTLVNALARAIGVDVEPRVAIPMLFAIGALFVPLLRELNETAYQWREPFVSDDSAFRRAFPRVGVTLREAVEETAAIARAQTGRAPATGKPRVARA